MEDPSGPRCEIELSMISIRPILLEVGPVSMIAQMPHIKLSMEFFGK